MKTHDKHICNFTSDIPDAEFNEVYRVVKLRTGMSKQEWVVYLFRLGFLAEKNWVVGEQEVDAVEAGEIQETKE
jgi:hypothetical protein